MDDHATPTRRSVAERASLALAFAIPLLMLGLGLWTGAFDHPQKDTALAELYTRHAARGDLLLGPYSRFGWHHPGPLLYYLYALP